ncbi:MAG: hypothetical protein MJK12_05880 [Colwellia sp.]|nr:hypothetical protein [Colwellia sp.]
MIIVVCTDDPSLTRIALNSAETSPDIFGEVFKVYHKEIPSLEAEEDLFIISHGAFEGDDGKPVIGDHAKAFYVNARELYHNIKSIFPEAFLGNIYIDACESATSDKYTISFATAFKLQLNIDHTASEVYGRNGTVSGLIPQPKNPTWVRA